jgi:peptidoglycan/xylan/chitin deacetylase (PgdA/CDA1 family)
MNRPARVPVLTWHPMNVSSPDYAGNEHFAFREDLETLHRLGLTVVPAMEVARAVVEKRLEELRGCVALTFDDGSDFDFHDLPHPRWGPQRSMARILADFRARHGRDAQPTLHATSFVIVSPAARAELDRACMIGCRWWNDDWWARAEREGLIAIESHGWDHNHDSLAATVAAAPRGSSDLATREDARAEIAHASSSLAARRERPGPVLFAYPYGHANAFLAQDYLPGHMEEHGVYAAFTTRRAPVTAESSRWRIPRYVFGADWRSGAELERMLREAGCLEGVAARPAEAPAPAAEGADGDWRDCLRTGEVNDARHVAGELFQRSFGHPIPGYPRHFVLVYSPPPGEQDGRPEVVAYVHQRPFEDAYLGGGMCVDERAYRRFPRWLFAEVRREGGLATIVTRGSVSMLGDSPVSFGYVGEPRARQADLRTGYVDTGRPHLMALWRREIPESEKARLIARVDALGPF